MVDSKQSVSSVNGPIALNGASRAVYTSMTGRPASPGVRRRMFRLDTVAFPTGVLGSARPATAQNSAMLVEWAALFIVDVGGDPKEDPAAIDRGSPLQTVLPGRLTPASASQPNFGPDRFVKIQQMSRKPRKTVLLGISVGSCGAWRGHGRGGAREHTVWTTTGVRP